MSDIAAQIIEETVRRCQALHEYAGRPAWEQVIRDVIQKHLVAMLAMERERAWNAGYLAGFMASGEGWNGEYPDDAEIYQQNSHWLWRRLVRWKEYSAPLPSPPEGGNE